MTTALPVVRFRPARTKRLIDPKRGNPVAVRDDGRMARFLLPLPEMARLLVARQVMRQERATVTPGETLGRAAELMESFGIRELPVVSGRTLVGVLTRTDMEPHRGHYEWTAVRAAMTSRPVTVGPETEVAMVARLLADRGFNAVPVTVGDEFLGMIARADLLPLLSDGD